MDLRPERDAGARPGPGRLARAVAFVLSIPIHLYRALISPLLPPACRFTPSCSAYALEALARRGPLVGTWLTVRRLARCHPWGGHGHDPVPLPSPRPVPRRADHRPA